MAKKGKKKGGFSAPRMPGFPGKPVVDKVAKGLGYLEVLNLAGQLLGMPQIQQATQNPLIRAGVGYYGGDIPGAAAGFLTRPAGGTVAQTGGKLF